MKEKVYRWISKLLIVTLLAGCWLEAPPNAGQITAWAGAGNKVVEEVKELPEDVLYQQVSYGTKLGKLNLPKTLEARVVEKEEDDSTAAPSEDRNSSVATPSQSKSDSVATPSQSKSSKATPSEGEEGTWKRVKVDWNIDETFSELPEYDSETPGIYVFEAELSSDSYELGSCQLPVIEVEVLEENKKAAANSMYKISGWRIDDQYIDPMDGYLILEQEQYYLPILAADDQTQASLEDILSMLPGELLAKIEGEDGEKALSVTWECSEYVKDQAGKWPTAGEYSFTAVLPEEYALKAGVKEPYITVVLGGVAVLADTQITIDTANMAVYANGIPIVVRENGSIVSVYDAGGNLLSGTTNVYDYDIYGGWEGGTHSGSTSVTVESGMLWRVFGGGDGDAIQGSTSVVINGGRAGRVYGGNNNGTVYGSTSVTVSDGTMGYVYGGGYQGTVTENARVFIESGAKVWGNSYTLDSSNYRGSVFGGGYQGTVTKTYVTLDGGDYGWAYGGGEGCDITEKSYVKLSKLPSWPANIAGGGCGGTIKLAVLKVDSATVDSYCPFLFGSGWDDEVEEVQIIISGSTKLPGNSSIYANWAALTSENNSTVGKASFLIDNYVLGDYTREICGPLVGEKVSGDVTVRVEGTTQELREMQLWLKEVDHLYMDQSRVIVFGYEEEGNPIAPLKLKTLDVSATSEVWFVYGNSEVTIDELSGSGKLHFQSYVKTAKPVTVSVGKVKASASAPLQIGTMGAGWDTTDGFIFFDGTGIEELASAACFKSLDYGYTAVKTADGKGIELKPSSEVLTPVVFTKAEFDKESYAYGESISLDLELMGGGQPIPGQVTITAGSAGTTVGFVTLDSEGKGHILLPVNSFLRDISDKRLAVEFSGDSQYDRAFALLTLQGNPSVSRYQVTAAQLDFPDAITAPALNKAPQREISAAENAFYTAQVVWNPDTQAFQAGVPYTASLRLTPKSGYDMNSVSQVTYQGRTLTMVQNGSFLEGVVENFEAIPEGKVEYEVDLNSLKGVPQELKHIYPTLEKLQGDMYGYAAAKLGEIPQANVAHYDITLMVSLDGGITWVKATEGNFPAEGVAAILPYPSGVDPDNYDFTVVHMLTKARANFKPGDVEIIDAEKTEKGLKCLFHSLSPITVGWKYTDTEKPTPTPTPAEPSDTTSLGSSDSSDNESDKGIHYDQKKGWVSSSKGVLTGGAGSGGKYSSWKKDEKGWWFSYGDGSWPQGQAAANLSGMNYAWELIDGNWWAFRDDGYVAEGWILDGNGKWYYIDTKKGMEKGWHLDGQDGSWYYMDSVNGAMMTGWIFIEGKWYYLNPALLGETWVYDSDQGRWIYKDASSQHPYGSMYRNEITPDGYFVREDGSWDGTN